MLSVSKDGVDDEASEDTGTTVHERNDNCIPEGQYLRGNTRGISPVTT